MVAAGAAAPAMLPVASMRPPKTPAPLLAAPGRSDVFWPRFLMPEKTSAMPDFFLYSAGVEGDDVVVGLARSPADGAVCLYDMNEAKVGAGVWPPSPECDLE